jgi:hypothetical protein
LRSGRSRPDNRLPPTTFGAGMSTDARREIFGLSPAPDKSGFSRLSPIHRANPLARRLIAVRFIFTLPNGKWR